MSIEAVATSKQHTPSTTLGRFFEAVLTSNPFAVNRVSDPSQMESDVSSIHQEQFNRLIELATESLRDGRGLGTLLLGAAGTGKSHMLARLALWATTNDRACFIFLHNIQVTPQDMNRYLLKCCISRLAEDRLDRLHDTLLFRVVAAAINKTAAEEKITKLNDENRKEVFGRLAARLGGDMQVFDVIFKFFCTVSLAKKARDNKSRKQHSEVASLAVRWLKGDLLDAQEGKKLGQLVPPQQEVIQLSEDQVEAVLLQITRLAAVAKRPFILCIDQADNMKPEQLTALGQTLHPLIDHAENLLVVLSGVRELLLKAVDDNTIPEAAADRLDHKHPIVINRIKRNEAQQILEDRLYHFLQPFEGVAEVIERCKCDGLFPLGTDWLEQAEPKSLELRPRDVLSWANERWRTIQARIRQDGGETWIGNWREKPMTGPQKNLTKNEIEEAIDQKVSCKIEEVVNARLLSPGTLPADAGNLIALTKRILDRCLDRGEAYTIQKVEVRGKQQVDLAILEIRPGDGKPIENHVQFVVTGSKTSAAFQLRKLLDSKGPDMRVLVTDHDRFPLQLGEKGNEYLHALEKTEKSFVHVRLAFEQYAYLDALEAVVGQACSGDLEIEPRSGLIIRVEESQVVDSHHRLHRYEKHALLRLFLTEELRPDDVEPIIVPPKAFPPKKEFREFVLAQLSFQTGTRTLELLKKFTADYANAPDVKTCLTSAMDIVREMHDEELVSAKPWENDLYLTIGTKAS